MTALLRISLVIATVAILASNCNAQVSEAAPCSRAVLCDAAGKQAMNRGDVATAIRLFKYEASYAEDAQNKVQSLVAYNNLASAYLGNREYAHAQAWTHLVLKFDSQNKIGLRNLAKIKNDVGDFSWPEDFDGIYVQYAGRGQWNSLSVGGTREHKITFQLLVYRMGSAWQVYGPAAYGDLAGNAVVQSGSIAVYGGNEDFPECRVKMRFTNRGVEIFQHGDCGFGHGVRASGYYERICAKDAGQCNEDEFTDGPPFRR